MRGWEIVRQPDRQEEGDEPARSDLDSGEDDDDEWWNCTWMTRNLTVVMNGMQTLDL